MFICCLLAFHFYFLRVSFFFLKRIPSTPLDNLTVECRHDRGHHVGRERRLDQALDLDARFGCQGLGSTDSVQDPLHAVSEQLRMLGGPRAAPALHHQANVVNAFLDDHLEARLAAHGAKPWCPRLKPGLCG